MSIEHYLLSLNVNPQMHMHCYLMSNDKRNIEEASNKMMDTVESTGFKLPAPIVLITRLSTGVDLVRAILSMSESVRQNLETATDFHVSIWTMPSDDPAAFD